MVSKWYVYIVQCSDNSYYTGITTDIDRRIDEHNTGKGAKYTRSRSPVVLEEAIEFPDRSSASKEEYRIKQLSRTNKEILIGKWRIDRLRKEYVYDPSKETN
jgi:putative endonuclease